MDRLSLDLGTARNNYPIAMRKWRYLYIGNCTGDVELRLGSINTSALNPNEFDKLTGIEDYWYLYVTNTEQTGKELNFYYEEEEDIINETEIET